MVPVCLVVAPDTSLLPNLGSQICHPDRQGLEWIYEYSDIIDRPVRAYSSTIYQCTIYINSILADEEFYKSQSHRRSSYLRYGVVAVFSKYQGKEFCGQQVIEQVQMQSSRGILEFKCTVI